jgi:GNAT superfamily N-acetyltransferase
MWVPKVPRPPVLRPRRARRCSLASQVMDGTLGLTEHETTLRDGTRVLLRPLGPDDAWRLREGLSRMSPRSRYMRFHTQVSQLSETQLRYLTEIDHVDHEAWGALDPRDPAAPGMGVARYVRLRDDPAVAEAAVTVLDEFQGRGLGTLLLRIIATRARENGITTFRQYVLAENEPMLRLLDDLDGERTPEGGGVWRIDMQLPEDIEALEEISETPVGGLLRAAARRALHPLLSTLESVRGAARNEHHPDRDGRADGHDDPSDEQDA